MAEPTYERLRAMDSSFLVFEGPNTHMNIGGTAIFEAGPLARPGSGVDIERIRKYIASRLHLVPRYRQRLAFVPLENQPVWIDDDHFNLEYHIRHTSLPRPGDEGQLQRLTARIMSQPLDRRRPLWETWIVEGLQDGQFAMISKVHHCMVDGISGVDLLAALLKPDPDETLDTPPAWVPRPAPTGFELVRDEVLRRIAAPLALGKEIGRLLTTPEESAERLLEGATAVWHLVRTGLRLPAETPLNRAVGPHRRFDWLVLDLAEVKQVKNLLGGTVNDVVLATTAGGVRRFLVEQGVDVETIDYTAAVPVSIRAPHEYGTMGNRVSAWLTPLPIQESGPLRRFARVCDTTTELKEAKQQRGAELLEGIAEWTGFAALTVGTRFASWVHPYNLIITNVPGPQVPLYMQGARMVVGYPVVPLFQNQGLGVAVFSYIGKLCWGINADWDMVPNVHAFVAAVRESFRELHRAAVRRAHRRASLPRPRRPPGPRRAVAPPADSPAEPWQPPHRVRRSV
jgi:diacylglycerol O-acyltransferase